MRYLLKDKKFIKLCLTMFLMVSTLQLIWLLLPFVVNEFKGSDTEIGLCFMGQMVVYIFCCMLAFLFIDKLNPHRLLLVSSSVQLLIVLSFFATVWFGGRNQMYISPVIVLVILMCFTGVTTAFFTPVISGQISSGYEGMELSKRLGLFNITWGIVNIIIPVLGGYLMGVNYSLPVFVALITSLLCFLSVLFTVKSAKGVINGYNQPLEIINCEVQSSKMAFVWMARVALLTTFICVGIFRGQVGIFYKFELGFAESVYGWSLTIMCLVSVTIFYVMGKSSWWHYKKLPFVLSFVAILASMLIIFLSKSIAMQLLAAAIEGISYGFFYSSHQYYGVSGGKKRSSLMAIHEIIVAAGIACGALFGGILSDIFDRYTPYKYACMFVSVAAVAQIILWFVLRKKQSVVIVSNQYDELRVSRAG